MKEILDFKPFVPSNVYEISKSFYEHTGFKINWDGGEVCEVDTQFRYRFLLLPKNHNNYAHSLCFTSWLTLHKNGMSILFY